MESLTKNPQLAIETFFSEYKSITTMGPNDRIDFTPYKVKTSFDKGTSNIKIKFSIKDKFFYNIIDSFDNYPYIWKDKTKKLLNTMPPDASYKDKLKFLTNYIVYKKVYNLERNTSKEQASIILKIGIANLSKMDIFNGYKISSKISLKSFSDEIIVEVSLNKTFKDHIFKNGKIFDSNTNRSIIRTLEKYFPDFNLDENINISSLYFTITTYDYIRKKFLGIITDFNKNTKSITFKLKKFDPKTNTLIHNNTYELKITKSVNGRNRFISLELNKEFSLYNNIDLI